MVDKALGTGGRKSDKDLKIRLKTAKGRTTSSTKWLQRQLNDPYVARAREEGYRSRAAFKIKEIDERQKLFRKGMRVVDLGAAPGGWTYQLLERSFFVTAVDNGKMAENLMASGMVDHKSEDAFKFKPKAAVDLLVCDMVEKPQRVIELVARWFKEQTCTWAVINLKLPMKKRFAELEACQLAFWEQSGLTEDKFEIRCKQLYHDREEVTLVLIPKAKKAKR